MIIPQFKVFLEDRTAGFEAIGAKIYMKVPYNENLVLLYCCDKFAMKQNEMDYMGVYSLISGEFLATSSAYFSVKVCDDFDERNIDVLEKELDERVQNELLAILESLVTPSAVLSNEIIKLAKDYKMKNKKPEFSFKEYEGNKITLENIEEFYADKDDYAYSIAEEIINHNNDCIQRYQTYVDIRKAIEDMDNDMPIDVELEMAIKVIKQETSFKNLKIQVATKNGVEERSIETRYLDDYPLYAIQRIYWGRKLLFDLDNYDATKVEALRTNKEYNLKAVNGVSGYHNSLTTMWECIDARMFQNYEFCKDVCKHHSHQYGRIAEKYRRSMKFIQDNEISTYILFEYTPEDVIENHKLYFMDLLSKDPSSYSHLPETLKEDLDFVCVYIKANGKDAIHELKEDFFQYDKVQKAFDDWYLNNPANLNSSWYDISNVKISLLKNESTKIYALNISYLKALTKEELNDKHLIMSFLARIEFSNSSKSIMQSADNFVSIYSALDVLKTDMDVLMKLIELCNLDGSCWRALDDTVKTKDMQRIFVRKNEDILSLMDDDIKLEFVYGNPKRYLMKMNAPESRTMYNGRRMTNYAYKQDIDEDLLVDLVRVNSNLSFLEELNYTQRKNPKLIQKLMKVKKEAYKYMDKREEYDFAKEAVKEFSVIQYLPNKTKYSKSLYDNREIMMASLEKCPEDFYYIPQASRQTGPAPLLSDKDFVLYAVKLDSNNANYIDPKTGLLEDEDICFEAVTDDIDTIGAFAGKLFRNESFVYRICEGMEKRIDIIQSDEIKEVWYKEVKEKMMNLIPKKIKGTPDFKKRFPKFVD